MNASFARLTKSAARGSVRPRLLRLVIVIAAVLIVSILPATARANNSERPTIVLVHGAWASAPGWDMVVAGLQKDGFTTATPTLGLLSIAGDVAIVRAVLDGISGPKILVGHSYGGIVISNAAYRRSDVLGLVFTAAFVPDQGDSIFSLGAGFHTSEAFNHFIWTGTPFASPAFIDSAFFAQFFCQDLNPNLEATLNAEQIPLNFSIALTPSGLVAWHMLPSWYAVSGKDLMVDPAEELFMAQRAGATTVVFPAASHAGGITHYATGFVKLIEEAVQEPADWSPVCSDQLGLYAQLMSEFRKFDAELLGVSVDGVWSHLAFSKDRNLNFPLLSDFDPKGAISRTYGVFAERSGESARALFVIDPKGIIRWSYLSPDGVNPGADGILSALEKLKSPG